MSTMGTEDALSPAAWHETEHEALRRLEEERDKLRQELDLLHAYVGDLLRKAQDLEHYRP